jgi:hypothetical protein
MEFPYSFSLFQIFQKTLPTSLRQREENNVMIPPLEKEGPGGICRIFAGTNRSHLPSSISFLPSPFFLIEHGNLL